MDTTREPFHLEFGIFTAVGLQSWVNFIQRFWFPGALVVRSQVQAMCSFWRNV